MRKIIKGTPLGNKQFYAVFLLFFLCICLLPGCRSNYERPKETQTLGEVKKLLFAKQHLHEEAFLVFRDEKGWAVMSTRCSYKGCDLTYLDESLQCSCCGSYYSHMGKVLNGPATKPLDFYKLYSENNRLFARVGEKVPPTYRFTTPDIELAVGQLRKVLQEEGVADPSQIPEILRGEGDGELGPMFKSYHPDELDEFFDVRKRSR